MRRVLVLPVLASLLVSAVPLAPATGEDDAPCAPESSPHPLVAGVSADSSVDAWSQCYFALPPVAGEEFLRITLAGIVGDADLRVRRGAIPTFTEFDCRSWQSGFADEQCEVENDGQTLYVMVNALGTSSTYTILGIGLTLDYCDLEYANTPLALGATYEGVMTTDRLAACWFEVVGDGATAQLTFVLDPGEANLDLFVRKARRPTTAVYDCFSQSPGTSLDSCELPNVAGARYMVMVLNRGTGGAFTLRADSADPCSLGGGDVPLALGVPVTASLVAVDYASCHFAIVADGGADALRFVLASEQVDADLFVKEGSRASFLDYDCSSAQSGFAEESCILPQVAGSTYHATATRWDGEGEVTMRVEAFDFTELTPGQPVSGTAMPGDRLYYKVQVPEGRSLLAFVMTPFGPTESNADMSVRAGAVPTAIASDCAPGEPHSLETCTFVEPADGWWYVVVRGTPPDPAPFRLMATYS